MPGQGTRNPRLWPSSAAEGFCCESSFLESSAISSCLRQVRAWEKREGGKGGEREREKKERGRGSLCGNGVVAFVREIVSENHTVAGIDSVSGQNTFWSGGVKAGWEG